jgi:hypothetical protein
MDGNDDNANVGSNNGGMNDGSNSVGNMVIWSMVVGVGTYIDGLPFCLLNI